MTGKAKEQTWVLLLRGINVNPTTRVAMAHLRALLEELGYRDVTTILQSGNVVLASPTRPAAPAIEQAIAAKTGVRSKVVALPIAQVKAIAAGNPLLDDSSGRERDDLSKMVITFLDGDIDPEQVERPSDNELDPEQLVITARAIYQWCPNGILQSKLKPSWWRQFGPVATTRNVRTVNRILAAAPVVE